MVNRILVPLDGSAAAEAALAYAAALPGREVKLLQVEPNTEDSLLADPAEWDRWREEREAAARAYLERAGERLRRQGRTVETSFAYGDPAEWIIAFAGDADLIVMTTHGRGAGGRALFGSVADRVARHAQTPALLVRGDATSAGPPQIARIVVPLDGSSLAEQALPMAKTLAGALDVPIHLLRALDADPVRAAVEAGLAAAQAATAAQADLRRKAEDDLAAKATALRDEGIAVSSELLMGSPAAALLDAIRPADLVVMTTHGRGGVRRWLLGSVADKLVREAAAPVLLVRGSPPAS